MAKKQTFETALAKLEAIFEELESGSPDLNKMLELFEEGMKLTQICRGHLNVVEERISTIIKDGEGFIEKSGIDPL